jgi:Na+/proline symporter
MSSTIQTSPVIANRTQVLTARAAKQEKAKGGPLLWTGRIMSTLFVLFMLCERVIHLLKPTPVVQAFVELGYPLRLSVALGIIELLCVAFYVVPRTSVIGAVLLTGYLGGAIATQLRVGHPLFGPALFPIYIGILLWGGLCLRENRLRVLVPWRS